MFLQLVSFCREILESLLGCLHIDFSFFYTGEEGRVLLMYLICQGEAI